jgi:hypothetical protein
MKNSNDKIGNGTRNLPISTAGDSNQLSPIIHISLNNNYVNKVLPSPAVNIYTNARERTIAARVNCSQLV